MSKNVCLFAYYDTNGLLPPYTAHYLKELSQSGWKIHLALSGQTAISKDIETFCKAFNITAHPRPNKGLDFGAWQDLIQQGCIENADRILLANDSVLGPISPLKPIFEMMWRQPVDVWGMIESYEENWHFQSWFLHFTRDAFNHPEIQKIFNQPFASMSKVEIIFKGELGLGLALRNLTSLRCKALWSDPHKKYFRNPSKTNPMQMDWYSVLTSGRVPFLKKELVRFNPFAIFWLDSYRDCLKNNNFFPLAWIDLYLKDAPPPPEGFPYPKWSKRLSYLFITFDQSLAWKAFFRHGLRFPHPF